MWALDLVEELERLTAGMEVVQSDRHSFRSVIDSHGPPLVAAWLAEALDRFGVEVAADDVRVSNSRSIVRRADLLTASWCPNVRTVRLVGGPRDGDTVEIPWGRTSCDPIELVQPAQPSLSAWFDANSSPPEIGPVVDAIVYERLGWSPEDRVWLAVWSRTGRARAGR